MLDKEKQQELIAELGKGLNSVYSWYCSTDIEALQALLCIHMLSDSNGYAQLVEVRRVVGTQPDKMTRCVRLLMGQKKSITSLVGGAATRQPLVDMTAYHDTPTVKRIGLTPKGLEIVTSIISPVIERQQKITELEAKLAEQEKILSSVESLGYDLQSLHPDKGPNSYFFDKARSVLTSVINDLAKMPIQDVYDLGLPLLQEQLKALPHFNPKSEDVSDEAQKAFMFNIFTVKSIHKGGSNDQASE